MDEPTGAGRRVLPLLVWIAALVAVLGAGFALGEVPALAAPPLRRPGDLAAWASAQEPVGAAFAVVRVVVLAVAAYLLVVTLLALAARIRGAGQLVGAVDVLTLPFVRGVIHSALGIGLVGAAAASVGAVGGERPAPAPSTWVTAAGTTGSGVVDTRPDQVIRLPAVDAAAPTLRRLAPDAPPAARPPGTTRPAPAPAPEPAAAPAAAPEPAPEPIPEPTAPAAAAGPAAPAATGRQVVIGAGDHLWSLAERALAAAWGATPSDGEVTAYWQALVDANQDRFADPANPDLVFPGQVLVLVAPPPAR